MKTTYEIKLLHMISTITIIVFLATPVTSFPSTLTDTQGDVDIPNSENNYNQTLIDMIDITGMSVQYDGEKLIFGLTVVESIDITVSENETVEYQMQIVSMDRCFLEMCLTYYIIGAEFNITATDMTVTAFYADNYEASWNDDEKTITPPERYEIDGNYIEVEITNIPDYIHDDFLEEKLSDYTILGMTIYTIWENNNYEFITDRLNHHYELSQVFDRIINLILITLIILVVIAIYKRWKKYSDRANSVKSDN